MQDWLAHRARATPGREALVNAGSGNAWSYATLNETVEEMAGRLHALDVEESDHVAAVLGTGVEAVCLIHAAMRLGTTLAPLSPDFTAPELQERIERADAHAVVCDAGTGETVRETAETLDSNLPVLTIDEANWSGATSLADAYPVEFTPAEWAREDVQLLLFTSGTTGKPKAVQLTMGNLLASAAASAFRLGIDPTDRWLVPLSLHHMGGIAPVLRSTLYGTTAIIRSSFDAGGTVDDLRSFDATCVSLVPTMLRRMLSARGTLPDRLRFVLVGGAPCPEELIDRCRDFSVPVCPTYGMTETASQIATARHREAYETPGSVGRPLLWTDVTVVDETGSPVPSGESGELVVNGPTVTPGYYDDHAVTSEAIGSYGLHTGDVGYQDEDGRLYVLNRLDDRILTGGENVDPGEIVDALRAHEAVVDASVVGIPDEQWGEQVAALVVPDEEQPELKALEAFLRERLAGFKLPRTIGFAEELPRTVSGTVERDAVREQLVEGGTKTNDRTMPSGRAASSDRIAAIEGIDDEEQRLNVEAEAASEPNDDDAENDLQAVLDDSSKQGPEGMERPTGETAAEDVRAPPERRGTAALSGDTGSVVDGTGSSVTAEPGAALGTERVSPENPADEPDEEAVSVDPDADQRADEAEGETVDEEAAELGEDGN